MVHDPATHLMLGPDYHGTRPLYLLDHQLTATQSTSCGLCAIMHLRSHAWPRTNLTRTWMNPAATVIVSLDLIGCCVLVQKYVVIYSYSPYCIKYVSLWSSTWRPCKYPERMICSLTPIREGSFMADRSGPCYGYIQRWKETALRSVPNWSFTLAACARSPANAGSMDYCSH